MTKKKKSDLGKAINEARDLAEVLREASRNAVESTFRATELASNALERCAEGKKHTNVEITHEASAVYDASSYVQRAAHAAGEVAFAITKVNLAFMDLGTEKEIENPSPRKNPSRPKKNGLPGEPPPGVYEWDSKKFPHPPDSYEIAEWRGGPRARKGNRPLIQINPCGTKNPAPSSIARGGKKLEELERALGSATFIFRASETEDNRRAVHRAMKALEIYRKKVGINPIENPSPRKLPGQAVLLGEAVELEVISDKGRRRTFKGGGAAALLSDADGDALAIVRPDATKKADSRRGSKDSASTWRKWSGFHVDGAMLLTVTDRPLKFSLGRVTVIRYRSDKWTGKALYYEHKFTSKDFHVWGDSASSPRAILITSFPPRRLVTARGIVG